MNEDLFYQDGYKLTLTNAANNLIDFKKIDNGKNYIQVELSDLETFKQDEHIKLNLTPAMPSNIVNDSKVENGYKLDWTIEDQGQQADCSFDVDFTDNSGKVYAELVSGNGDNSFRLSSKQKTMPCFWMSGGSVRLMKKRFPRADQELMQVDLPYINGVNVKMTVN